MSGWYEEDDDEDEGAEEEEVELALPAANLSTLKTIVLDSSPITVPLAVRIPPTGASGPIVLGVAFAASASKASNVFPDVGLQGLVIACSYCGESLTH
jgi:hypothetical protein